ncbi:Cytochrome c oxidase subunit 6b [Hibiscus syriacus]|uniref:Cytochrome c oxidase subunit 6b n=1 Tax=Hibiscus syriacus TaxID=106335 RepID=A0A6A3B3B5_HIBSY|nr:Cytochrome c oxidase subunit 6b [Hibiscus syriacus]
MADDKAEGNTQEVVEVPIAEENPADAVVVVKNEPKPAECPKKSVIPGKFFQTKRISGLLSVVSFVFSLPVLSSVIWLLYMKSYDCESLFKLPKLQTGISVGLICVFFVCNATLFLRDRLKMVGIVLVMVPLTVMFTVGLAFLGADSMENRRIPATPLWFEMKTHDDNLWSNIKRCIYDAGICHDLALHHGAQIMISTTCRVPVAVRECYLLGKKDKTENESNPDCNVWKNTRTAYATIA